jgi:hypothetical protein
MGVELLIGTVGSIASIVQLALMAPSAKSRALHLTYASILVVSVFVGAQGFAKLSREKQEIEIRLTRLESVAAQATALLDSRDSFTTTGGNRGFFLIGLAFLEKNRADFPEMFAIAKDLGTKGLRITESVGSGAGQEYYDEQKRMDDGANAMRAILRGIAGPTTKRE